MSDLLNVHLVDGTYELFRAYYGAPPATGNDGSEVGAARALARSMLGLIVNEGATHVAVAFDTVIESFRNDLFDGYKTGEGIDPALHSQFPLAEQIVAALGITVWSMIEFEADDALAAGAARFGDDPRVGAVHLCTPDKDLAQCVEQAKIVMVDRRRKKTIDESGVLEKFGVRPRSIPDYLALVGDSADGIPGIPKWGARSASTALFAYDSIEAIPDDHQEWSVKLRGAAGLAESLRNNRQNLSLYKRLATLRTDVPLAQGLDDLHWRGAKRSELEPMLDQVGAQDLLSRIPLWRDAS